MLLLDGRYAVPEPCTPGTAAAAYDLVLDREVAVVVLPGPWRGERAARRLRLLDSADPDMPGGPLLDVGVRAGGLYVVLLPQPTPDVAVAVATPPQQLPAGQGLAVVVGDARTEFGPARVLVTAAAVFTAVAAALAMDGLAGL